MHTAARRGRRAYSGDAPLMALLALAASVAGKICDRVVVDGRESCGPALLVPDFAQCGAHFVEEFTKIHPHLRWATAEVSVPFDPVQVVRDLNPGVTPDDGYVWAVRMRVAGNADPLMLGADLTGAFPSAKVLLSICDPSQLPYRLFVDGILMGLGWSDRPITMSGCALSGALAPDGGCRLKASPQQLQSFVQEHGAMASLRELFWAAFSRDETACRHRKRDLTTFQALRETFTVSDGLFEPSLCERWQLRDDVDVWPAIRGSREDSLAVMRVPDANVRRWIEAGYELITDHQLGRLAVVVMENWPVQGRRYIELVQRLLLLTDVYPWSKADFSLASPPSRAWLAPQGLDAPLTLAGDKGLVLSSCDHLALMLGEHLAWPGCDVMPPSPPSSSPLHPCVWDRYQLESAACSALRFSELCERHFEAGSSTTALPRPCAWHSGRCAATECHTLPPAPPPSVLACYAMRYADLLDGYCAGRVADCDWDALRVHYETAGEKEHRKRGNCDHPPFPPPMPPEPPSPWCPPALPPAPAPPPLSRPSAVSTQGVLGMLPLSQMGFSEGEVRVILLGVAIPFFLTLLVFASWLLRLRSEHGHVPSPRELQLPPVPTLQGRRTAPWRSKRYASLPAEEGLPPGRVANTIGYGADVDVL